MRLQCHPSDDLEDAKKVLGAEAGGQDVALLPLASTPTQATRPRLSFRMAVGMDPPPTPKWVRISRSGSNETAGRTGRS